MKFKIGMGLAAIFFALIFGAQPASAHAVLVFSNPQVEQLVPKEPQFVEVEFNGNLIQLGKTKLNVLTVKDSSGAEIDDGNSVVSGPILKVGLRTKAIKGDVSVSWRVVSSDGHPVEGGYTFYVGVKSASTAVGVLKQTHNHEGFIVHHRFHIAYFLFGFLAIGLWAFISVRTMRGKGRR